MKKHKVYTINPTELSNAGNTILCACTVLCNFDRPEGIRLIFLTKVFGCYNKQSFCLFFCIF